MSHNVRVLLAARIVMSAARSLAAVVVPIYLALIGFSAVELGVLFLTAGLVAAALSSLSGTLSDKVGRRPFLVAMPLLAAAAAVGYAATSATAVLFLGAALGSFGRGAGAGAGSVGPYQPVESAVLAQSTPARWRNAAFGWVYAGSTLGALGGGLLATLAGNGHVSRAAALAAYRPAFFAAAALATAAGLLGLAVRDPRRRDVRADDGTPSPGSDRSESGGPARDHSRGWRRLLVPQIRFPRRSVSVLVRLWVTNSVNGVAIGMIGPFLTYWFYRRYHVGPEEVGILFAVINGATVASSLLAPRVARRFGLIRTIAVTRVLSGVLLVPMAFAPVFWAAGLAYLVRTAVQRVQLPLRQSFVLSAAHPEELASVAGLAQLPAQVVMSGGPLLTGYLFDEVSLSLPFVLSAALMCVNGALYWVFFRTTVPEEERDGARPDRAPPPGLADATDPDGPLTRR